MKNKVIIVGGFVEIIELCEENGIDIYGIIDKCNIGKLYNYKVICKDEDAEKLFDELKEYRLIITPDMPYIRKKLNLFYQDLGYDFTHLISSSAKISKSSLIGIGTIIQTGVNISSEVNIGKFVKINSMANVMHNTKIGNYSTIAPNAVILGFVNIGSECYIGANSTILPQLKIADNVIVGAGSVVTKDITESGSKYAGIPAKKIE